MGNYINYNGGIVPGDQPILMAGNRNFQYGDGLFETMRVSHGKVLFVQDHFERLFDGLKALKFTIPTSFNTRFLEDAILNLCLENRLYHARIRLTVFRDNDNNAVGNPHQPAYLIESWELNENYSFNSEKFSIGIYSGARKAADDVSSYKTCSYLPYAMAAVSARQQGLNDCLVLNTAGRIC
ncbi:MAG TPA: aminotransferase class IV, partial [Chitinophagaceae bacterium]